MKKTICFLILLISISGSVFGQITGTGTYIDPYTGTMTSGIDTINSGTRYFNQITVSGGTLIIRPGATLLAKLTNSSIQISGTGILSAVGESSNIITFSADHSGNGTYETGEKWYNLLFDGGTGTSIIDYALIEYGTGDGYLLGGGIDIYDSNVTVRNTTIRNCDNDNGVYANGGGICLDGNTGTTVYLENLKIYNNNTSGNGGGIYLTGSSTVNITGCEIYNNTSIDGDGVFVNNIFSTISNSLIYNHSGDGVYFTSVGNLVNCDVLNNTVGVRSYRSSSPKIINSVLWGNGTQLSGTNMNVDHCGVEGGYSSGTNIITLSSTNGADTGPNFTNSSSDFHINYWITPLIDNGTPTYSGVNIPGTDLEGNSRISTIDIGAYEYFYYKWNVSASSSDWATTGNWEGSTSSIPTSFTDNKVVISKGSSFYPTVTDLTLSSRSILTIEPQAGLTVTGSTTVSSGCKFLLQSDLTGSANFVTGTSVSGDFDVELYLAGGGNPNYKWHYVMTPVDGYSKAALTTDISNPYNLLNYLESVVTTDRMAGWNWHDTYEGATPGFSLLDNSTGYNVYVATTKTALFTGSILQAQDVSFSLSCGTTSPASQGWNLIGNPFTCGVNADDFTFGANAEPVVYYTSNNSYLAYNTFTKQPVNGGSNNIPALQGFFVHATNGTAKTVGIPASSRTYSAAQLYKGTTPGIDYPFLKLNVSDGTTITDESIIYFFKEATTAFDRNYDAYKMLSENPAYPQIYSTGSNVKYAMNGLPIPDQITEVPLKIRIGASKNYTINILKLENLPDCKVSLIHGTQKIDLKSNPSYTFYASAGTIDMTVIFDMTITTNVEDPREKPTACWYSNGAILINAGQSGFEDNSTIIIYDVNGRVVYNKSNASVRKGETFEIPVSLANGFYITTIFNKSKKLVNKIVISY